MKYRKIVEDFEEKDGMKWEACSMINSFGKVSSSCLSQYNRRETSKKHYEKNKEKYNLKVREDYSHITTKGHKRNAESLLFNKTIRQSMGICLMCGNINWDELVYHHVFGRKTDEFQITLCANCHHRLHWNIGMKAMYNG